jgi:cytoskeletal protein CcmA (bactofilin family)
VFKKVIGQNLSESARPSPVAPTGYRQPEPLSPPADHSPAVPVPTQATISRPPSGNSRNILSSDVDIKGTVKFTNDLIVDGKIEGEISSDGSLTVGENARLKAEIKTATVVVYGKVHGNITALDRIELKATAEVIGDIKTKTLSIEAGAIFVGKSTVGTPAQAPAPSQTPAAAQAPAPAPAKSSDQAPQTAAKPDAATAPKQGILPGAV